MHTQICTHDSNALLIFLAQRRCCTAQHFRMDIPLLHAFTHRHFHTHKPLHRETFAQNNFHTKKLSPPPKKTSRYECFWMTLGCPCIFICPLDSFSAFYHIPCSTLFYRQTTLRAAAFTQSSFYPHSLCPEKLLHTKAFTHRGFAHRSAEARSSAEPAGVTVWQFEFLSVCCFLVMISDRIWQPTFRVSLPKFPSCGSGLVQSYPIPCCIFYQGNQGIAVVLQYGGWVCIVLYQLVDLILLFYILLKIISDPLDLAKMTSHVDMSTEDRCLEETRPLENGCCSLAGSTQSLDVTELLGLSCRHCILKPVEPGNFMANLGFASDKDHDHHPLFFCNHSVVRSPMESIVRCLPRCRQLFVKPSWNQFWKDDQIAFIYTISTGRYMGCLYAFFISTVLDVVGFLLVPSGYLT